MTDREIVAPRDPALDGVRGLAILQVLVWHYNYGFHPALGSMMAYAQRTLLLTWSGVDLFFVLSGFLIGGILLDHRRATNYFRVFYVRRGWRILPLYLVLLGVGYLLQAIGQLDADQAGGLLPFRWYATFTQNIWMVFQGTWGFWLSQTWSLAIEEQFYLLLPLTIWLVPRRQLLRVLLALIIVATMLRVGLYVYRPETSVIANFVLLPTRMDALLLGVLCAHAIRVPAMCEWLTTHLRWLYGGLMAGGVFAALCIAKGWGVGTPVISTVGLSVLAFTYSCLLLVVVLEGRGPLRALAMAPPLRRLGLWAYYLYLVHTLMPHYVFKAFGRASSLGDVQGLVLFALSIAVLCFTAELSWRVIERPLIAVGHRWRYGDRSVYAAD